MSFIKKLTSQKPAIADPAEKKFCLITCIVGAAVSFVSMVLMLIMLAGYDPTYVWSSLALGLGVTAFFVLAFLRHYMPDNKIIGRVSDASVWLVLFGVYTPIALMPIRQDLYENGSIVCGWVIFGVIAFFSLFFLIAALATTVKFRLVSGLAFLLMAFAPVFGTSALLNSFFFAPALPIVLLWVAMLAFAATPIIFWFFDRFAWQRRVFYILMTVGTLASACLSVIWAFAG